jgi:DNA-binding beta-propeller fold protein YncE
MGLPLGAGARRGVASAEVRPLTDSPAPRTVAVGINPEIILLDQRRHLAFVGNEGTQASAGKYVRSSISMMDMRSATVRATVPVTGGLAALALDERAGRLFFSTVSGPNVSGTVNAVDEPTGAVLRTIVVGGNPFNFAVDQQRGHVFVSGTPDGTSVLDATSGRLLAEITLGRTPGVAVPTGDLALDQHTARLFTVDAQAGLIGILDLTAPPGPRMLVT